MPHSVVITSENLMARSGPGGESGPSPVSDGHRSNHGFNIVAETAASAYQMVDVPQSVWRHYTSRYVSHPFGCQNRIASPTTKRIRKDARQVRELWTDSAKAGMESESSASQSQNGA